MLSACTEQSASEHIPEPDESSTHPETLFM
jgi:hypothetical protein